MPSKVLLVNRGETVELLISVLDTDGTALNLDTATSEMEFEIAEDVGLVPVVTLTYGSGITKLAQSGATLGQASIVITSANNDRDPATYKYDLVLTLTGGARKFLVSPSDYRITEVVNQP